MKPKRIQRKRTKGWKMPLNTVYVGRPSRWGNEFEAGNNFTQEGAVDAYIVHLQSYFGYVQRRFAKAFYPIPAISNEFEEWIKPLKGKNLACWCPLIDKKGLYIPCHADILLSIANEISEETVKKQNLSYLQTGKTA